MVEAKETAGIFTQEQFFFLLTQQISLLYPVERLSIGNRGDGARIVRSPHQFLHPHFIGSLTYCLHSRRERVIFIIEQPSYPTTFNIYVWVMRQLNLFHPVLPRHHAKVANNDFQFGKSSDNILHFIELYRSVSQFHGKHHTPLFHQTVHLHKLRCIDIDA